MKQNRVDEINQLPMEEIKSQNFTTTRANIQPQEGATIETTRDPTFNNNGNLTFHRTNTNPFVQEIDTITRITNSHKFRFFFRKKARDFLDFYSDSEHVKILFIVMKIASVTLSTFLISFYFFLTYPSFAICISFITIHTLIMIVFHSLFGMVLFLRRIGERPDEILKKFLFVNTIIYFGFLLISTIFLLRMLGANIIFICLLCVFCLIFPLKYLVYLYIRILAEILFGISFVGEFFFYAFIFIFTCKWKMYNEVEDEVIIAAKNEVKIEPLKYDSTKHKAQSCIICLDVYNDESKIVQLKCHDTHVFHYDCIIEWYKKNKKCPNCRQRLPRAF